MVISIFLELFVSFILSSFPWLSHSLYLLNFLLYQTVPCLNSARDNSLLCRPRAPDDGEARLVIM